MFNFGIIGAGYIANKFCNAVSLVKDANVVAVASSSIERAKDFAAKNSINDYYDSYEDLLKREDIDAVYIATTHNFHYNNLKLCLDYNKPILCEKCMVLTKAEAEEIFRIAEEKNIFVMECMWSRFLPAFQKAKEWIQSGKIGDIQTADYSIGFHAGENHRVFNPELAGGAMYDIGVYGIEGLTYLIQQELKEVKSMIDFSEKNVDATEHILLQFESCIASIQCTICANIPNTSAIYGTKGYINIPNANSASECFFYGNDGSTEHFYLKIDNGFEYQIQGAIECIKNGQIECAVIPHKDTIQCAEIFDACLGTK